MGGLAAAFVIAVALHDLEEAVWLPAWSANAGAWHRPVGAFEFRFAVAFLAFAAAAAAVLALLQGLGSVGAYLLAGYALAMLANVFVPHVAATILMRRYMPGTATGLALVLPLSAALLSMAFAEGWVSWPVFAFAGPAVAAGLALSIPLLFAVGRRLSRIAG